METATSSGRGYLLALLATILWSTVFPLVRVFPRSLSPIELAFWRWLFTFCAMLPFGIKALLANWEQVKQNWKWMAPSGIFGFSLYSILMFEAGHTTDTTNLALFAATAPVFMALLSRFVLKEQLNRYQITGLLIAILGVVVLVLHGDFTRIAQLTFTIGDIWMLLAAALFGVYSILVRKRPQTLPQSACMMAMLGFGLMFLIPLMAAKVTLTEYVPMATSNLAIMGYIAVIPTLIGYMLWNKSVEYIGASRAGIVYYSIPMFSSFEAVIFLGERVSASQICGGALIIGGILLSSFTIIRAVFAKDHGTSS